MSPPLPVRFVPQLHDGYCLPACAQMALAAFGIRVTQQRLAKLLGTQEAGTPFSCLQRLANLGVEVDYGTEGTLARLSEAIAAGTVPIAAVHAGWLPYAKIESPHAVVVITLTGTAVTVLDPATTGEPLVVPVDAWLAAWIEMERAYALITKLG